MEVILIQGNEKTGKTTLCKILEKNIIRNNFREVIRKYRTKCGYEEDFTAIYEKNGCKIIINSESEKGGQKRFKSIYDANKHNNNCTIITAIRPAENNRNLNKWIKDVYKYDFSDKKEIIIDLDKERNQNSDLDFCEFIEKVLAEKGNEILENIKNKINCNIGIKCIS